MKKKLGIAAIIVGVLFAAVVIYSKVVYGSKWYANTTINGLDVSGMTLDESKKLVSDWAANYSLAVKGRDDGTLTIKSSDIDYKVSSDQPLEETFKSQHNSLTLPFLKHKVSLNYDVNYNTDKLSKLVSKSAMVAGSDKYKIVAPEDATYKYDDSTHNIEIVKEVLGNTIKEKQFTQKIEDSLKKLSTKLNVSKDKSVYKQPKLLSTSEECKKNLSIYRKHCMKFITVKLTKKLKKNITPTQIISLVKIKNGKVTYSDKDIENYVERLCLRYKTEGKTRKFKSHTGKTISISGGDFGWRIDYDDLLAKLTKAIKAESKDSDVSAYAENASAENKKALTTNVKVNWTNTGYVLHEDKANLMNDYNTKDYIEVDLSAQYVYVFKKGKVVFKCPCITGLPTAKKHTTPGAWYIKQRQTTRVLVGENNEYRTPVAYWARITWTGIGFHAAPWQAWGAWSPNSYRSVGSHGCVNLSTGNAASIYGYTYIGQIVFIH